MPKPQLIKHFQNPFVVMDTEFTTWKGAQDRGWSKPDEWREIVQIAALKVDPAKGFREEDTLDVLIKPTINPVLSGFFQELTGINQQQVDEAGLSFARGLQQFADFAGDLPVWCYGMDDKVILENCLLQETPFTPARPFYDVRMIVKLLGDTPHAYTSGTLHKAAGIDMDGHVHNALHDCRSIVQYLKHHFGT